MADKAFAMVGETKSKFDMPGEPPKKEFPWVYVAAGIMLLGMVGAALWIIHGKPERLRREAAAAALSRALDSDTTALRDQREKVETLTQNLTALRQAIQWGQVPDRNKAIEQYKQLVDQQRAEGDRYAVMARQYNEKVTQLRQLQ